MTPHDFIIKWQASELTKVERDAKSAKVRQENEAKAKFRQEELAAKRSREKDRDADAAWREGGRRPAGNRNFTYEARHEPEPGLDAEADPFRRSNADCWRKGRPAPLRKPVRKPSETSIPASEMS